MMNDKENMMIEAEQVLNRELKMYGMSQQDIKTEYMESLTAQCVGMEMVVATILSDCQHWLNLMENTNSGDVERREFIRKQLNVAKYILTAMWKAKRVEA